MVHKKDLYFNYLAFDLCSAVCTLPVIRNGNTGELSVQKLKWENWIWWLWFGNGFIYGIFVGTRLIQRILLVESEGISKQLPFHITVCLISLCYSFWAYTLFIKNPHVCASITTQLCGTLDGDLIVGLKEARKQYSTQDLLILMLPPSLFFSCPSVFVIIFVYDSNNPQFLFSVIPENCRCNLTLTVFIFYETLIFCYFMSIAYYVGFVQVSFFQHCIDSLQRRVKYLNCGQMPANSKSLRIQCMEGKIMQLQIKLFNQVNAYIIFSLKLILIGMSVPSYYISIRLIYESPVLSFIYASTGVYNTLVFVSAYDKAFALPGRMNEFRNAILLATKHLPSKKDTMNIDRISHSIPNIGIKVGGFHTLERLSTPTFVDFIVNQVFSMLVAF